MWKNLTIFSAVIWPFFVQNSSKIVNLVFSSKMLNFTISFVFRPKRISCVPKYSEAAATVIIGVNWSFVITFLYCYWYSCMIQSFFHFCTSKQFYYWLEHICSLICIYTLDSNACNCVWFGVMYLWSCAFTGGY